MTQVIATDGERIERTIRKFRKKVERAGILSDFRHKRHYVKPSAARRAKSEAARHRRKRREKQRETRHAARRRQAR
jgi:small subunit ribosomal protein S21